MSNLGQFAVVAFVDENDDIEVIPTKWITSDRSWAWWPKVNKSREFWELVNNCTDPVTSGSNQWEKYRMRIIATAGKILVNFLLIVSLIMHCYM